MSSRAKMQLQSYSFGFRFSWNNHFHMWLYPLSRKLENVCQKHIVDLRVCHDQNVKGQSRIQRLMNRVRITEGRKAIGEFTSSHEKWQRDIHSGTSLAHTSSARCLGLGETGIEEKDWPCLNRICIEPGFIRFLQKLMRHWCNATMSCTVVEAL